MPSSCAVVHLSRRRCLLSSREPKPPLDVHVAQPPALIVPSTPHHAVQTVSSGSLVCALRLTSVLDSRRQGPRNTAVCWAGVYLFLSPSPPCRPSSFISPLTPPWALRGEATQGREGSKGRRGKRGHQLGLGLSYDGSSARITRGPFLFEL